MQVERLKTKFPNLDFSKFVYVNNEEKSSVTCLTHGEFQQSYRNLLRSKRGCPLCQCPEDGRTKRTELLSVRKDARGAINDLKVKFPNLDFSEFIYKTSNTLGKVCCPVHGIFEQTYKNLMRTDYGCRACAGTKKKDTEGFITEVQRKLDCSNIDFSATVYTGANDLITFTCRIHGEITDRTPAYILGRPAATPCAFCNKSRGAADSPEDFREKVQAKFPDMDEVNLASYVHSKQMTEFTCLVNPEHGSYWQHPGRYLNRGSRCPKCSLSQRSLAELDLVQYLCSLPVKHVVENVSFPSRLIPDILLPAENLVIDYHGLYYHSDMFRDKDHLLERLDYFSSLGFKYVQIFEDEWIEKQELVKERLRSFLGLVDKVPARKTYVRSISKNEADPFLETHHLQGSVVNSSVRLGLYLGEELISVATFGTPRTPTDREQGFVELHRFASKLIVVGGFTKLFSAFEKLYPRTKVVSYADRRWGDGNVYAYAGFKRVGVTQPGYFWSKNQRRYSRWNFQKHKLATLPEFSSVYSPDKTEDEMCRECGYVKVYDAGHVRWEK